MTTYVFSMKRFIYTILMMASALAGAAQDRNPYLPEIHGTIRAKYEYQPQIGQGRFQVRNARLSVQGKIIPIVRYKAEIDLSDE